MSVLLGLLFLLAPSHAAEEAPQVVFAQIGYSVTLPRISWGEPLKLHVNWNFKDTLLISRNPTSVSPKIEAPPNWQGRLSLSSDLSLIISPVHESDFGIFTCEQHELMRYFATSYKLYRVTMTTVPPLLAGAILSLSCEIDLEGFKRVHPTVRWLGPDNTPYIAQQNLNKYTLSVSEVSSIDSGKWTCEVTYGAGSTLNAITNVIIIDLAPSPLYPIYTSDSTSNFPIPCSLSSKISWSIVNATGVTGGHWSFSPFNSPKSSLLLLQLHPNPSPVWKVPNGTHSSLMETNLKNHELDVKISKVSTSNRGTYTCSLEFRSTIISRSVQLEVLQVISSANNVEYEGNTVNLTCTLGHSMSSDLEVEWIPPRDSSLPKLSPPHPKELSIPEVGVKDSGRWTCQLKRNATVLTSATVRLKIGKAPVNIWLVVAIAGGVLVFILLPVIAVIIVRRRRQVTSYRRGKKKYCCCKNPQAKGFYKT